MSDHEELSSLLMSKNPIRQTYLVTYRPADKSKFQSRESFGREIAKTFDLGDFDLKKEVNIMINLPYTKHKICQFF